MASKEEFVFLIVSALGPNLFYADPFSQVWTGNSHCVLLPENLVGENETRSTGNYISVATFEIYTSHYFIKIIR